MNGTKHDITKQSPASNLRRRQKRSYAESGLGARAEVHGMLNNENKVLVYIQQMNSESEVEKGEKLDSNSEEYKKKKPRKSQKKIFSYNTTLKFHNGDEIEKNGTLEPQVQLSGDNYHQENSENVNNAVDDEKNLFFGFDEIEDYTAFAPKIQIVHLNSDEELHFNVMAESEQNKPSDAANTAPNNYLSPWRFNDIHVVRNPHFLQLKDSSLPRLDQEMVLDYSTICKLEDASKVAPQKRRSRRAHAQKTITDYFNINVSEANTQINLFEDDHFRTTDAETSTASQVYVSTPNHSVNRKSSQNSLISLNYNVDGTEYDEPLKLSVSLNDKKYCHKQFKKVQDFSDNTQSKNKLQTPTIVKKDKQLKWMRGNRNSPQNHKKVKEVETEEREVGAEAENLVANFSLICEEIENFPLEVE